MGDTDRVIGAEVAKDGAPGSEAASGAAEDTEMDIGRQKEEALREALLKKRDCSERGEAEGIRRRARAAERQAGDIHQSETAEPAQRSRPSRPRERHSTTKERPLGEP